jgi:hypothetical protein
MSARRKHADRADALVDVAVGCAVDVGEERRLNTARLEEDVHGMSLDEGELSRSNSRTCGGPYVIR